MKAEYHRFNPGVNTLIESLETIKKGNPCKMYQIQLCRILGFKWLWEFRNRGFVNIRRNPDDGRSHLVWLTDLGMQLLEFLQLIKDAHIIHCGICKERFEKFYKVPNDEWKRVTGDEHEAVICRKCFETMRREKDHDK